MASTVPALLAGLKAALEARPGLAGVQISNDAPFPVPEADWIWLSDVVGVEESARLGNQRRREWYGLVVLIRALVAGVDGEASQSATTRVYELRDEVADQLRSDPTVSGVVSWALMGGDDHTPGNFNLQRDSNGEHWMAQLTCTVACMATING